MASVNSGSGNLCAVDGCKSSKRRDKNLSFFHLPADEEIVTNRPPAVAMSAINRQQAAMFTNNVVQAPMSINNVPQATIRINNAPQAAMCTNNMQQVVMSTSNVQQAAMGTSNVQQAAMGTSNVQQAAMGTNNVQQAAMDTNNVQQAAMGTNNMQQVVMGRSNVQQTAMGTNNVRQAAMGTNNVQQAAMGTNNMQQVVMGRSNVQQAAMGTNNVQQAAMGTNNVQQAAMGTNNVQQMAIGADNLPQGAMSYPVQLVYDAEIQINPGPGMSNYSLVIVKPQPLIFVPSVQQQPAQMSPQLLGSNRIPPWLQKYTTPASQPQNYQNVSSLLNCHIQRPYGNEIEGSACVPRNAIATAHPGQISNNLNAIFHVQSGHIEPNSYYQQIPNIRYINQGNNNTGLANDREINSEHPRPLTNQINNVLIANGQRMYTENPSNFTHNAPNSLAANMQRISPNPPRTQAIVKQTHMRATPNRNFVKPKPINVGSSNTFGVRRMTVSSNEMLMTNLANAYTQKNATTTNNATQTPTKFDTNQINWNNQSVSSLSNAIQNTTSQMNISNKNKIFAPPPNVIMKNKHSDNADKGGVSNHPSEAKPQGNSNDILTSTSVFNKVIPVTKENAETSTSNNLKDLTIHNSANTSEGQPIELQKDTKIYYNGKRERSCEDGELPKCKRIVTKNNERETMTSRDLLSKTAGSKKEKEVEKVEEKRSDLDASILEEKGSYKKELNNAVNQSNKKMSKEAESKNLLIQKPVLQNEEPSKKKGQDKGNYKTVSDNENKKQGEDKDTFIARKLKEKGSSVREIDEKTTTDQNNENRKRFDDQKELNAKFMNKTNVLKHSVGGVVIRESKCSFQKKFGSKDIVNIISNNEDLEKFIQKNEIEIRNISDDEEQVNSTSEVEPTPGAGGQNNLQTILSHVINGFVIQESNKPFAIRRRNGRISNMSRSEDAKALANENKNIQNNNTIDKNINNKEHKVCLKASIIVTDAITNDKDKHSGNVNIIEINNTAEKDTIVNDDAANNVTKRAKMIRKRKASQKDKNKDTIIKKNKDSAKNIIYSDSDTSEEESNDDNEKDVPEMKNPQPVNSVKLKTWSSAQLHAYLRATWCDCLELLREQDVDGRALLLASRRQLIDVGVHAAHARTLCQFARLSRKMSKG